MYEYYTQHKYLFCLVRDVIKQPLYGMSGLVMLWTLFRHTSLISMELGINQWKITCFITINIFLALYTCSQIILQFLEKLSKISTREKLLVIVKHLRKRIIWSVAFICCILNKWYFLWHSLQAGCHRYCTHQVVKPDRQARRQLKVRGLTDKISLWLASPPSSSFTVSQLVPQSLLIGYDI